MKKVISAVTACFVSSFLFLTGCSDPDAELKSKVPDSVDAAAFVDGAKMVKNKAVSKAINDAAEELKDEKISIADLENRYLFFGSVSQHFGGVVLQSREGKAEQFFKKICDALKKSGISVVEKTDAKECLITLPGNIPQIPAIPLFMKLYHQDLLLIAYGKTDPAFFKSSKPNRIFQYICFDYTVSAAYSVDLSAVPQEAKQGLAMLPALYDLNLIMLNVPNPDDDLTLEFHFTKEDSAGQVLAALNMGLALFAQKDPELSGMIKRSTEKNILKITLGTKFFEYAQKAAKDAKTQISTAGAANLQQEKDAVRK